MPRIAAPTSVSVLSETAAAPAGGGHRLDVRAADARRAEARPVDDLHHGNTELAYLRSYLIVVAILIMCGLVHAKNRLDKRETSMAIESARSKVTVAKAERARLHLELATLQDPDVLRSASEQIGMDSRPKVVDLPPEVSP